MSTKNAISFAGGGIRGFSHIGIVDVMEQIGISADMAGGTSMGSVVASMYAAGMKSTDMLAFCMDVERAFRGKRSLKNPVSNLFVPPPSEKKSGLAGRDALRDSIFIQEIIAGAFDKLGKRYFKDLEIPLLIPAVDINTSKLVFFCSDSSGFPPSELYTCITDAPISVAVRASCAFPLLFSSVIYEGNRLVDGGMRMNIPIWPLRMMGADKVLACALQNFRMSGTPRTLYDTAIRAMDLMSSQLTTVLAESADKVLTVNADDVMTFDTGVGNTLYLRGVAIAAENRNTLENFFRKET
jgi:NTE family protein